MLPCAIATDSGLGCAIALAFARAAWDMCVYFDVRHPGERAAAEQCCAVAASLGRHAVALPVDVPGLGHSHGASALIGRCVDEVEGLGRLPRCLINAPAEIGSGKDDDSIAPTPMRLADGDVAPNTDGGLLLRLNEVNVAPALALSEAFHHAWTLGEMSNGVEDGDRSVINLIDSGTAEPFLSGLAFVLTQASMRAATPLLAKAFAPHVRVVGLAAPLLPSIPGLATSPSISDALCEAVLFLANASTTTGSILLADGGAQVRRAERQSGETVDRKSVASMSGTAPEIAADPHGE